VTRRRATMQATSPLHQSRKAPIPAAGSECGQIATIAPSPNADSPRRCLHALDASELVTSDTGIRSHGVTRFRHPRKINCGS
jgi:hypothetical protein